MGFVEECFIALETTKTKGSRAGLADALAALERELLSRRPGLTLEPGSFASFLVERLPSGPGPLARGLAAMCASDVYLGWACLQGQLAALAEFEAEVMPLVERALRGIERDLSFVREGANTVRERLLMPRGDRHPGLAQYQGNGPLAPFAMVVAMRVAMDLKRQVSVNQALEEVLLGVADHGPRADDVAGRRELKPTVQAALASAMAALTPRQRTLLKLHLVQGVSAEQLGKMYRVHRATTTRWLTEARQAVVERLHARLKRDLKLGPETFASLKSDLVDGLDLTLSGMLSNCEPPPEP